MGAIRRIATTLRSELSVYRLVMAHPGTPWYGKALFYVAIAYLCMPFDLIPDWIPLVGHVDDVVIVPVLVYAALRLTPPNVVAECRGMAGPGSSGTQ